MFNGKILIKTRTMVPGSHRMESYQDTWQDSIDIAYDGELTPEVCSAIIEESSIPLPLQFDCVDAMQRILNITDKQPEFSDAEIDAIYCAMGDYQDYGDEESALADTIREKLS